jgi:hypothetical protein
MAKRARRIIRAEETAHFVVYDKRTGAILAVHHVSALPGVRAPSEAVITRRVRACAAEALRRRPVELAILTTRDAPTISPGLRVDVSSGRLRAAGRQPSREGDTAPEVQLLSP